MTFENTIRVTRKHLAVLAPVLFLSTTLFSFGTEVSRFVVAGNRPPDFARFAVTGRLPATNSLSLSIGLPLRNQAELKELLHQLYNPASTNFHHFLTSQEFTARFGPTEADYQAVRKYLESNGFTVTGSHPNRLVLDVAGSAENAERAFAVSLLVYRHPSEPRDFFAPDVEPSVPTNLPVADMWGLSDYALPTPLSHIADASKISPLNYNGTGMSGSYEGRDYRNAYAPGTALTGTGQTAAVAEFDGYYANDITTYEAYCGYANVPLTNILLSVSGTPSSNANQVAEVSLDIELQIAMAPGLSQLMVYEGNNPYTVFNRIATDNTARQISCSWSWKYGPTKTWLIGKNSANSTLDNILSQMAAQGQSFFQAAGDSDADTGSQSVNASTGPIPVDSIYVTSVGGTSLTMSGGGGSWSSETVWNWGNNTGTAGGISSNYTIPSWQTNVSMALNNGSTVYRNFPDVAMTADAVEVVYNNGSSNIFGGTSCAAPLWAGFTALANQQALSSGSSPVGFLNPALYSLAGGANYGACFHDITTGNNIGNNTPGLYNAVSGYDLATGLGTPNGTNLINALAPPTFPYFTSQPASQTVTNGGSATFSASAGGQAPLGYRWLFDGTNLPAGGNIAGVTSNTLTLSSVTAANAGNYTVVVTNSYGAITSSVATLTVTFPPSFITQPTNQSTLAGNSVQFGASVGGATPLVYQWRQNGTNLANGGNVSGAFSNVLTLTSVVAGSAGNYILVATNIYGAATSSIATLTVYLPPAITVPPVAQTIQCGSNASFSVTASGTAPLKYQWSLDGAAITGATNTSLSLTNVHLPNHTVAVAVTNLYGSVTNSAALTVQDTLPPAITLNSTNPYYVQFGNVYVEPGATAYDLCAGAVPVTISGVVNTNAPGTNAVTYTATDGNGNANTATRTVIVQDTTPPTIVWSFTNLVLAASPNCQAPMPDVTGTNYLIATDASDTLTITQNPTNNAALPLGTNLVVMTVADLYGNKSYSTNHIVVRDVTPPAIALNGFNPMTNELGAPFADPGVTASDACSGLALLTTNGVVNINVVGTNVLTYTAVDGSGNSNSVSRTVFVRDTTPPAIQWSFTNLVLIAGSNCVVIMPDVTGSNFIQAADLSGVSAISQTPTNNAILPVGTNVVVIAVADAYGNTAYSTNQIVAMDHLPTITAEPKSQAAPAGSTANFSVSADACTALSFQWLFNGAPLPAETGSALTLTNLTGANAGNYSVAVTSSGGSVTSAVAVLTVNLFSSAVTLVSSANPDGFKDQLTFTAVVTPTNATGAVQFLTNGTAFDQEPLVAGTAATTNLSALPRGTNLVAAIYSGDGTFMPATNSFEQIVTNHPPVVLPAFYTLVAGTSLTVVVANLATNWSDPDGDAMFIASISVSTNGVAITNTLPALYYSDTNHVNDRFVCAISDGFGGTNFEAVNITVVPQTNSTPLIATAPGQPGTLTLQLGGAYGSTYVLQSATNLMFGPWAPVATNTLGVTGVWQFTDWQTTNYTERFYRLMLVQ